MARAVDPTILLDSDSRDCNQHVPRCAAVVADLEPHVWPPNAAGSEMLGVPPTGVLVIVRRVARASLHGSPRRVASVGSRTGSGRASCR